MPPKIRRSIYLIVELIVLFTGLPILLTLQKHLVHPSVVILPLLFLLILYLHHHPEFHLRELIHLNVNKKAWRQQLSFIFIAFLLLLGYTWFTEPHNVFILPRQNPTVWLILITLYPIFSAYGQEVIFRLFLKLRYQSILSSQYRFIVVSATLFSFAHIIYYNLLSILLTFIAGL